MGNECERSILTLRSQVPSAYPAMCGIQREAKKNRTSSQLESKQINCNFIVIKAIPRRIPIRILLILPVLSRSADGRKDGRYRGLYFIFLDNSDSCQGAFFYIFLSVLDFFLETYKIFTVTGCKPHLLESIQGL